MAPDSFIVATFVALGVSVSGASADVLIPISQNRNVAATWERCQGGPCTGASCVGSALGFGLFSAGREGATCYESGAATQASDLFDNDNAMVVASSASGVTWVGMGCDGFVSTNSTFSATFELRRDATVNLVATASRNIEEGAVAEVRLLRPLTGQTIASILVDEFGSASLDETLCLSEGLYRLVANATAEPASTLLTTSTLEAVLEVCVPDLNCNGEADFGDLLAILGAWGPCEGCPEDLDEDGGVGLQDVILVLSQWGACSAAAPVPGACRLAGGGCRADLDAGECDAMGGVFAAGAVCDVSFCRDSPIVIEPYVGEGWLENGFGETGLTAYRLYATFDEQGDDGVLSAFGDAVFPLRVESSDGLFHNAQFDSLTAPLDLTSVGIWENQWDTYVTIGTDTAQGDQTQVSPGFADDTNSLRTTFEGDNLGWLVTLEADQSRSENGRVLLGQFVVAEGETAQGMMNLVLRDFSVVNDIGFGP